MKLLLAAVCALTAACAAAAPQAVAPAQSQTASEGPGIYEGTYALQAPSRVTDLRVWVDAQGRVNGELVDTSNQTTSIPTSSSAAR